MASAKISTIIFILAIFVPSILGKEFIVGDDKGWTPNFDYPAWAEGREFYVGDTLVFNYPVGAHNVFRVNGTAFQQCTVPPATEALATGKDVITLATPGRKWYICGVAKHCESGNQKLAITVLSQLGSPATSPSGGDGPSSSPVSPASGSIGASAYLGLMLGFMGWLAFF